MKLVKKIKSLIFKKVILKFALNRSLYKAENSKTYSKFCELVYGKDLTQFNMADMEQIDKLVEVMNLDQESKVLDLGCGAGRISEYIQQKTDCDYLGIDYANKPIKYANIRNKDNHKLNFIHMDFNNLKLKDMSFDAVIAIDTIYFATDLEKLVKKIKSLLNPGGKLLIFSTEMIGTEDSRDLLKPETSSIGKKLKSNGYKIEYIDYTEKEKNHWKLESEVAEQLKDQFFEEKNRILYSSRKFESDRWLEYVKDDRLARYLYIAKL